MVHLRLAPTTLITPRLHLRRLSEEVSEARPVGTSLIAGAAEEVGETLMIEATGSDGGSVVRHPDSGETFLEMDANLSAGMTGDSSDVTMSVEANGLTENGKWIGRGETYLQADWSRGGPPTLCPLRTQPIQLLRRPRSTQSGSPSSRARGRTRL